MIKQSKAFVRKVSYSYGIRLIDEVSQASSATCWYGQFFERLQSVSVVDGAAHTQKDDVESNEGSLENVARSLCCSFATFSWF